MLKICFHCGNHFLQILSYTHINFASIIFFSPCPLLATVIAECFKEKKAGEEVKQNKAICHFIVGKMLQITNEEGSPRYVNHTSVCVGVHFHDKSSSSYNLFSCV